MRRPGAVAHPAAALILLAALLPAHALPRSAAAKAEFRKAHPCPATGQERGACPGWVIDHVEPLCAGGLDAPSNMQWQELAESKVKDRDERAQCAAMKKGASRRPS